MDLEGGNCCGDCQEKKIIIDAQKKQEGKDK